MSELLTGASGPLGPQSDVGVLSAAGQGLGAKPLSPGRLAWRRFRRHKLAVLSAIVLVLLAVVIFFPSILTDYGPNQRIPEAERNEGPSAAHWFGTDGIRRDQLARVLYGGQISLQVGVAVALVSAVVGCLIGAIAAVQRKWVDNLLMRTTDLFLAIPLTVAFILMSNLPNYQPWAASLLGKTGSVRLIVTVMSLFLWMPIARIVRGVVLGLREKEFVEAAHAVGATKTRILLVHLLPNCIGPIIVSVTLSVASAILVESALSFLGFGVQSATTPTLGNLLSSSKGLLRTDPHLMWFPGLTIVLIVLCVNYLGDGLRDAFDPKQGKA